MRTDIKDLARSPHEFGARALVALAEENSVFEFQRRRSIRDRFTSARIHNLLNKLMHRAGASA